MTFEGNPLNVNGLWKFSSAAAVWGVLNFGNMDIEGLDVYEEVDIFGFDPGEKVVHLFSVTNTSATHDHSGTWVNDRMLSVLFEGLQDGKAYREEILITILSPTQFTVN